MTTEADPWPEDRCRFCHGTFSNENAPRDEQTAYPTHRDVRVCIDRIRQQGRQNQPPFADSIQLGSMHRYPLPVRGQLWQDLTRDTAPVAGAQVLSMPGTWTAPSSLYVDSDEIVFGVENTLRDYLTYFKEADLSDDEVRTDFLMFLYAVLGDEFRESLLYIWGDSRPRRDSRFADLYFAIFPGQRIDMQYRHRTIKLSALRDDSTLESFLSETLVISTEAGPQSIDHAIGVFTLHILTGRHNVAVYGRGHVQKVPRA